MPERKYYGNGYRFAFNGQEKSDEIKGIGNSYTAEFWEYDPRTGRRWNLDPVPVAFESQYVVNGNDPNFYKDPLGDFKSKFGAKLYSFFFGGTVSRAESGAHKGEWAVSKQVAYEGEECAGIKLFVSYTWGFRGGNSNNSKSNEPIAPGASIPLHLRFAINEIGQSEIKGKKNNPRITVEYFQTVGLKGSEDDLVPWCSAFANWCITRAGMKGPNDALALSWRKWKGGEIVTTPSLGDIVTIRHANGTGHTGFVTGGYGNKIAILGGNQALPGDGSNGVTVNNKWNTLSGNMVFIHPRGLPIIPLPKIPVAPLATQKIEQIGGKNSR